MSSNDPMLSKTDPLSFDWTERPQQPRSRRCKIIGGGILICLGVLVIPVVNLYSVAFRHDVTRTQLTKDQHQMKLKPQFGTNYAKFTYDIIRNTYSLNNRSNLRLKPYVVTRIERVVDRTSKVAYLQNQPSYTREYLQWYFDFSSPGKSVEKLEIKMKEIQSISNKDGGEVRACLYLFDECTHFPANGSLTLENPSTDALHITIKIHDNNVIFKSNLEDVNSTESLSIEVYWKDRYPNDISTTSFISRWWAIDLEPLYWKKYARFTYDIVNNTSSNNDKYGLPAYPYSFENVERVVDRSSNVTYLHKKRKDAPGWIQWVFDLHVYGKLVDSINIKLEGMKEMEESGGKVQACKEWIHCSDIPVNGIYISNRYYLKYFTIKVSVFYEKSEMSQPPLGGPHRLQIVLDKDIEVLKTNITEERDEFQWFFLSVSMDVHWEPDSDCYILRTPLKFQRKPIILASNPGEDYVKFTYFIVNNTYSHNHQDGNLIEPYFVDNVERVRDSVWFQSFYLRKEKQFENGTIRWMFDLKSSGRTVEKIVIKMDGIEKIAGGGGKAEACLASHPNCIDIPIKGSLLLEKPHSDYLIFNIELLKEIKVFAMDHGHRKFFS